VTTTWWWKYKQNMLDVTKHDFWDCMRHNAVEIERRTLGRSHWHWLCTTTPVSFNPFLTLFIQPQQPRPLWHKSPKVPPKSPASESGDLNLCFALQPKP
jgi:hypothetical protein